jgi:RimJ/RimL family protein N-acetyltransferase
MIWKSAKASKIFYKRLALTLSGFGITLSSLQHDQIEMVRHWRNSDHIKRYARQQEPISAEQQETWFSGLQTKEDEYFVISAHETPVGLIWFNAKNTLVETGFYLYDETEQNSLTPYKIVTLFHEYLFDTKQFESIYCHILHDNTRALRFNLSLGYTLFAEHEQTNEYILTHENYAQANAKILKLLKRERP